MFDPQAGDQQIHDFNPGIRQNGLFWTTIVSPDCIDVDFSGGTASMEVDDIQQKDFFTIENALRRDGPTPRQGRVSFRVEWTATSPPTAVDNPVQQYRADIRDALAQMEWSGRSGDYEFQSHPLAESTTDAALMAIENNGSYY